MWLERFVIVVTSLHRDFLPSSWGTLPADDLGLRDLLRHDRPVPDAAVPVPAVPADDLDLRDADAAAGGPGRRRPEGGLSGGRAHADHPRPDGRVRRSRTRWSRRPYRAQYEGYRRIDAYSPFPIEELHEALGMHHNRLPLIVLIGGLIGCIGGYLLQYWAAGIAYPLNVGGKPFNAWPMFIPVTFECTILGAALSAVLGMLALERPADAVSPGLQRAAFRARQPEPVLPVHRSARSEVQPRGDAPLPRNARAEGGLDRCPLGLSALRLCALRLCVLARSASSSSDAARTCTTSRATARSRHRRSSPTTPPRGRRCRAPSRAASCATTSSCIRARSTGSRRTMFPFAIDDAVMARGQEAFNAFCSPCHGRTGRGDGIVVKRGYTRPPDLTDENAAQRPGRPLLRRDHERLRRDAGSRRADQGARSLGDRRLRARAAGERVGRRSTTSRRPSARGWRPSR